MPGDIENKTWTDQLFAEALKQQQSLEKIIENLSEASGDQSQSALQDARLNVHKLSEFFSACLDPTFYTSTPTAGSARVARKVFDTTELAEEIFSHLLPMDLLRAQQVDRGMRDVIQSSKKLQRQMFLISDEKMHLATLRLDEDSSIKIECAIVPLDVQTVKVTLNTKYKLPHLGSRVLKMQLCQPRLQEIAFTISCCWDLAGVDRRIFRNPNGITLGDLYTIAKDVMCWHALCPRAPLHRHHEDGFTWPTVTFKQRLHLQNDDPIVLRNLKCIEMEKISREKEERRKRVLRAYVDYKRHMAALGVELLTLAEYQAVLQVTRQASEEGGG